MSLRFITFAFIFSIFLFSPLFVSKIDAVVAFPGAEGFGAQSVGGRGGRVIEVTNLNDSGTGSFRDAVMQTGPRIIVFRVGGTITLNSRISVGRNQSFLTIAGQTAPGDGVQIKGWDISLESGIHDVVIRYLKFRTGETSPEDWSKHTIQMYGNSTSNKVENIIIDHCSFFWGPDEGASSWEFVENVTWSWNIFEGLRHDNYSAHFEESKSLLIGTDPGGGSHMKNITVHHNFMANSAQRNPGLYADGPFEVINNLVYNWEHFGTEFQNRATGIKVNLIGNYYKRGPVSSTNRYAVGIQGDINPDGYIYVKDNIGPFRANSSIDEWAIVGSGYGTSTYWTAPAPKSLQKFSPWPESPVPVTTHNATQLAPIVLATVGASYPKRDSLDQRVINDYNNNTGTIKLASQQQSSWWPTLQTGTPPQDTDKDGIPDTWEQQKGLDANNQSDGNAIAPSGYTWIEEYLSSLVGGTSVTATISPRPNQTGTNTVTATPVPKLGDANGDREVDGVDYLVWLNHYNQTVSGGASIGDFNTNGKVDGQDFVIWLTNYQK